MAESQRRKGAAGERELVRLLPGSRKVSGMYVEGPDLVWLGGRMVEVKRRKRGAFAMLYRWIEDVQLLAVRADNREWLIVVRIEDLLDMIEEGNPHYGNETDL